MISKTADENKQWLLNESGPKLKLQYSGYLQCACGSDFGQNHKCGTNVRLAQSFKDNMG